jgi:hypothetical protein
LEVVSVYCARASEPSSEGLALTPAQSRARGAGRDRRKRKETGCRGGAVGDGTYCIERALPVVGDVGLAFRRFLEDPFVTLIRGHLSHQPAGMRRG